MTVQFTGTDAGVKVVDPIERRQLLLRTGGSMAPRSVDPSSFVFPVSDACVVETGSLSLERADDAYVRNGEGRPLASVLSDQDLTLPRDEYVIEISAPIKLYLQFEAAVSVTAGADRVRLSFDGPVEVAIGARSYHKRPAATITTPDEPTAMMEAVSALSSALQSTTCERAYPTLRGHPPLLERGDELDVPSGIEPPDTGVEIVIPPSYEHVYAAAPLAFYTGATLVPGESPRLRTETGWEQKLGGWRNFEDEVANALKQLLLMDCVVRTEGLYPVDLHERSVLEASLPFDLEELYHRPIAEQLPEYLSVPFQAIEEYVPRWVLTAHIPAEPRGVEALPFVCNELGVVRLPRGTRISSAYERTSGYTRGGPSRPTVPAPSIGTAVRGVDATVRGADVRGGDADVGDRETAVRRDESTDGPDSFDEAELTLVQPERTDESIEHAWFGDHLPRGATKATVQAYRSKLARNPPGQTVDITVVCNDAEMVSEQESIDDLYGDRSDLDYDVHSHYDLSTAELREILANPDSDFLHFIGHATPDGLECHDGRLDVCGLDAVGVDAFLFNACQSWRQAVAMTERGAIGGIGTLGDVENDFAGDIGRAMARLLNLGFHLRSALELVREHTAIGEQYLVFGDGSVDLAQPEAGTPFVTNVTTRDDGYRVTITTYPMDTSSVGGMGSPSIQEIDKYYLSPGTTDGWQFTESELRAYLGSHRYPVRFDGQLKWNQSED